MKNKQTDLSTYSTGGYSPGKGIVMQTCWYFVNILFLKNSLSVFSGLKVRILKWFGADIGTGVVIKPSVNIKYPWRLTVGDHTWIGENVWIDNLADVTIGSHVCLSQGAMLLTGNHNYKKESFDLITKPITLEDGVWIGAKTVVCPGVHCKSHSVLAVGSVAIGDLDEYSIYQGNPAAIKKKREIV